MNKNTEVHIINAKTFYEINRKHRFLFRIWKLDYEYPKTLKYKCNLP